MSRLLRWFRRIRNLVLRLGLKQAGHFRGLEALSAVLSPVPVLAYPRAVLQRVGPEPMHLGER